MIHIEFCRYRGRCVAYIVNDAGLVTAATGWTRWGARRSLFLALDAAGEVTDRPRS